MSLTLKLRAALLTVVAAIFIAGAWHASATGPLFIETIAGGYANDGGLATATPLDTPQGLAVDASGNIYVADAKDCRVRKISGTTITTVAGNGGCGFGGDGGLATAAALKGPEDVAVDSAGNIYIADTGNCRIRKVSGGTISTFAGFGACFFSGDGGPATSANLSFPFGIAVDSAGNVFIADTFNCRIREVSGGFINTIAGSGTCAYAGDGGPAASAQLNSPQGITVDASGNLYIADTNNCMVRKVTAGTISLLAGHVVNSGGTPIGSCAFDGDGLTATVSALYYPSRVAISGSDVYITDTDNCLLRDVTGGLLNTVAGSSGCGFAGDDGSATLAQLSLPVGVAVSGTNVYIADGSNCRVRQVAAGTISTIAGNGACGYAGDGGAARLSVLHGPSALAVSAAGDALYVTDTANCRVRKIAGGTVSTIAGNGACAYGGDGGTATSASLNKPQGIAIDASGNLYIADTENCRVRKVSGNTISTFAGTGVCGYAGDGGAAAAAKIGAITALAINASGNLYISDTASCVVRKVTGTTISTVAGNGSCAFAGDGGTATSASLNFPHGLALDSSGNLYIADTTNCRVRKVTGTTISTVVGSAVCGFTGDGGAATSAQLSNPQGLALDTANNLYIADTGNCRVRKVTGSTIATYAGNGTCSYGGDFAAPASAIVNTPYALTSDSAGDIFIADTENNRVRVVSGDADGDTLGSAAEVIGYGTNPALPDTDADGCGDGKEVQKFFLSATNGWDFYSVPIPALFAAQSPLTDFPDNVVVPGDANSVFAYFKRGASVGTLEYEEDLNANGVKDGREYDRSLAGPGQSGPPDGTITPQDANIAFAQFRTAMYVC